MEAQDNEAADEPAADERNRQEAGFYDHSVEGEEDLAKYEAAMAEYARHMVQLEKKAIGQNQQFCRMAGNALCHNLDVNLELLTKAMAYRDA